MFPLAILFKIGNIWNEYFENIKKEMPNFVGENEILPSTLSHLPDNTDTRDPQIQGLIKYIANSC